MDLASIHALLIQPQGRALCFHFIQLRFFQPHQWHFLIFWGSASELKYLLRASRKGSRNELLYLWGMGEGRRLYYCSTEAWKKKEALSSCLWSGHCFWSPWIRGGHPFGQNSRESKVWKSLYRSRKLRPEIGMTGPRSQSGFIISSQRNGSTALKP